jgi:hypothetical protein
VAGIRCADAAGALRSIERKRVGGEILEPELLLEARANRLGFRPQRGGAAAVTQPLRKYRGLTLRVEDVALNLAQRDRRGRELPIVVEDRVGRVLPSLIDEPRRAAARVLDEPVAVAVAEPVDPRQRPIQRRSN